MDLLSGSGAVRSHMPRGPKNWKVTQKQYCNKFNKDFKNGPHQKKEKNLKDGALWFWEVECPGGVSRGTCPWSQSWWNGQAGTEWGVPCPKSPLSSCSLVTCWEVKMGSSLPFWYWRAASSCVWMLQFEISLLLFSCSVVSDSLWPHGLQRARFPCPSPSPRVCSDSCPLSRWCHPTSSSSLSLLLKKPVVQIMLQDIRRIYKRRHGLMPLVSSPGEWASRLQVGQWFIDLKHPGPLWKVQACCVVSRWALSLTAPSLGELAVFKGAALWGGGRAAGNMFLAPRARGR